MGAAAVAAPVEREAALGRFSAFGELSDGEARAVHRLAGPLARLPPNHDVRVGVAPRASLFLLVDGWVLSSVDLPDGGRQILKVHLPGDLMGAPGLPFDGPVETLTTLTPAQVSSVSLTSLGQLFTLAPRLGALLFLNAQEERVHLMDRLTAMGRLDAERSVASLLVHLYERLAPPPAIERAAVIDLPMTQPQIGDVLGLTSVHVSRVMGRLEKDGAIRRVGRKVELADPARLRRLAGLPRRRLHRNPAWLPVRA